jgi:hypothetical protein
MVGPATAIDCHGGGGALTHANERDEYDAYIR